MALLGVTAPATAAGGAATLEQREAFREALQRGQRQATLWRAGWLTFHTAGLARNLYRATGDGDSAERFDGRVDSVRSLLAVGTLAVTPSPYADIEPDASPPGSTLHNRVGRLSAEESRRRSPAAQGGALLVNAAGGLAIGIVDERPGDGALNFLLGMLVNTVQTYTQPRVFSRLEADWQVGAGSVAVMLRWP